MAFEELDRLVKVSRGLELKTHDVEMAFTILEKLTLAFKQELGHQDAYSQYDEAVGIDDMSIDTKVSLSEAIEQVFSALLSSGINTASGKCLGYIPGGGIETCAIADYIAALTNRFIGYHYGSPAAVEIENQAVQWLIDFFDMPAGAWGTLTSGGSMGNLLALLAARDSHHKMEAENRRCYLTKQSHHSLMTGLTVLGIRASQLAYIASNDDGTMSTSALRSAIKEDVKNGRMPWLLIANAGTTNTGAIDPLTELADIATAYGLWMHVDAAYGGFFYKTPELKRALEGIASADSLTVDPHKGMFLSYGCGATLVRRGSDLSSVVTEMPAYLNGVVKGSNPSPADYSIELTRPFRGLRLWLTLKVFGEDVLMAAIREKVLLARYLYRQLLEIEGIDILERPQLTVVCFRVQHDDASGKESRKLQRALYSEAFVSSTDINDVFYLRACILCFRTHQEEVDQLVKGIRSFVLLSRGI